MSDRFYQAQLAATGSCPGNRQKTRRRKVAWDDEKKQLAVEMYEAKEPTPENSIEIIKEIADEIEENPNGVRMILVNAGVYVKKAPASGGSAATASSGGSKRVSKADAIEKLTAAISDTGQEPDEEIISKLTGKAALYFAEVINSINA